MMNMDHDIDLTAVEIDQISAHANQRTVFGLIGVSLIMLWATATATPNPLMGKTLSIPLPQGADPLNDGLDCATGMPSDLPLPENSDITDFSDGYINIEARVAHVVFTLRFDRVDDLMAAIEEENSIFWGGIGVYNPALPLPGPDPSWYFNVSGNMGYDFGWDPDYPELTGWKVFYDQQEGWLVIEETTFRVEANGNTLTMWVPFEFVPEHGLWYA